MTGVPQRNWRSTATRESGVNRHVVIRLLGPQLGQRGAHVVDDHVGRVTREK